MIEESINRAAAIGKALEILHDPSELPEYRQNQLLEAQTWLMVANTFKSVVGIKSSSHDMRRNEDSSSIRFQDVNRLIRVIDDLGVVVDKLTDALAPLTLALSKPEEPQRPPETGNESNGNEDSDRLA